MTGGKAPLGVPAFSRLQAAPEPPECHEFEITGTGTLGDRGVAATQAARDLNVHVNVLRKWVKAFGQDLSHAFPGQGHMKPEEMARLRREVARPSEV